MVSDIIVNFDVNVYTYSPFFHNPFINNVFTTFFCILSDDHCKFLCETRSYSIQRLCAVELHLNINDYYLLFFLNFVDICTKVIQIFLIQQYVALGQFVCLVNFISLCESDLNVSRNFAGVQ